jgi:uncharacterized protein (TIGR04255 family)
MTKLTLPKKLTRDSIREALVEIRFESEELPEIVVGRLADYKTWGSWSKRRLSAADIPSAIRESDPMLKFQPEIELFNESENLRIRIGGHAISIHNIGEYYGWDSYKHEIGNVVDALFEKFENITIKRIGLRYINALTKEAHLIESISDLSLGISIGNKEIADHINLSYFTPKETCGVMVKIATPLFVQDQTLRDTSVIIDVDVFTLDSYTEKNKGNVIAQIGITHEQEKEAFFALLSSD